MCPNGKNCLLLYSNTNKTIEKPQEVNIKIHPEYEHLRVFIENIPNIFKQEGVEIYNKRNLIKVFTAPNGTQLNVKRFHKPHGPNSFIYSWGVRQPKGKRAFEYANILTANGIDTPQPIALIEERNVLGLLGFSYLVSLQCNYGHTLYEVGNSKPGEYNQLAEALAHFAARIHQSNILHKDFTPGNILWKQDNEGFHFMLVDINRMRFGTVSIKMGLKNLCRFWGPKDFTRILASEYAKVYNYNEAKAVDYVMSERRKFWTRYGRRHEIPFDLEL